MKLARELSAYERSCVTLDYCRSRATRTHEAACQHVAQAWKIAEDTVRLIVDTVNKQKELPLI